MDNAITRWDSMRNPRTLRDAMDQLFESSFVWPQALMGRDMSTGLNSFPMDIYENDNEIVVSAALPGIKADDLNIQFTDGTLVLDANLPAPKLENQTIHYRELFYGRYHREVTLPVAVDTDHVEAVLENGLLTLHLPKAESIKPKKITVKSAQ